MLPNGAKEYKSLIGSVMTLLTIITVALYAVYKWQLLVDKEETSLTLKIKENYYDTRQHVFDQDSGFNIALGIYKDMSRTELFQDDSYGKFAVYNVDVLIGKDGEDVNYKKPVPLRNCNVDDIPLANEPSEKTSFYKIRNNNYVDMASVRK